MVFKKGHKPWNIGLTKETDARVLKSSQNASKTLKGKIPKNFKEMQRKGQLAHKGKSPWNKDKKLTKEHVENLRKSHTDLKYPNRKKTSKRTKRKQSKARKGKFGGKNHPNWQGGKSFESYGLEFNEDLKEVIRNRDRRKCVVCEKIELENKKKLSVHHIDYNKRNNNPNNLISLCRSCHVKTNYNREYWISYFQTNGTK